MDPYTATLNFLTTPLGQRIGMKLLDLSDKFVTLFGDFVMSHMSKMVDAGTAKQP